MPPKGLGEGLRGTGGTQGTRRCTWPPGTATASWSRSSSLQVPRALDHLHTPCVPQLLVTRLCGRLFAFVPILPLSTMSSLSFHCVFTDITMLDGIFTVFPVSPHLFSPSSTPSSTSFVHPKSGRQTRSLRVRVGVPKGSLKEKSPLKCPNVAIFLTFSLEGTPQGHLPSPGANAFDTYFLTTGKTPNFSEIHFDNPGNATTSTPNNPHDSSRTCPVNP